MENRIQVNGVWYVKETAITEELHDYVDIDISRLLFSSTCDYENDMYAFTAVRMQKEFEGDFYEDIHIEFTDKRPGFGHRKTEFWDNPGWFSGLLEHSQESIDSLNDTDICEDGKKLVIGFLYKLKEIRWI